MFAARAVSRVAARATTLRASVRRMGGGGGHHHEVAKELPPRPELPSNATLKQKIEHALWYKRNPNYEGFEAYVRYYMPENAHLTIFFVALYGSIAAWGIMNSKAKARKAVAALPAPDAPDYHTPLPALSDIPEFGSDAWVSWIEGGAENVDKWVAHLEGMDANVA